MSEAGAAPLAERCARLVAELGLGTAQNVRPLSGGVSSDIAAVTLGDRTVCAKFALPKLRVAADWTAPVRRNAAEYLWLQRAKEIAGCAPDVYGRSDALGGFAMEHLAGEDVYLWKDALMADAPDQGEVEKVADAIGRVHNASREDDFDREGFDNFDDFYALRCAPYFLHSAQTHREIAPLAKTLVEALERGRFVLVHGDLSPKNIIFRNGEPIILEAECATLTQPAFDVAFCINHLILKAIHKPHRRGELLNMARRFLAAYLPHQPAVGRRDLDGHVARFVAALMLARVDGKSPVEYLTEGQRETVRRVSLGFCRPPAAPFSLDDLLKTVETADK